MPKFNRQGVNDVRFSEGKIHKIANNRGMTANALVNGTERVTPPHPVSDTPRHPLR